MFANGNRTPQGSRDDATRAKARRTRIEDLSQFGYELPEEQLRLVIGGLMNASAGTCCIPDACDDD